MVSSEERAMFYFREGKRRAVAFLVATVLLISGWHAACAQNLTVFAAASLKNALDEIDAQYQPRSKTKTAISYASSSALAKQVESGAPADIFISADLDWMDYLEKRNLVRGGSRINLLRNEIVLIAPADSKTSSVSIGPKFPLAKLLGNGRLAMGDPDHVPAGKYGKAALEALEVWPSVADRLARAENVRAALIFVSRGEAPFGIVYRTDAAADRNVRIVGAFPASSHPAIVYPAAMLTGGKSPAAEKYFEFLKSAEALGIFKKHGFVPYQIERRATGPSRQGFGAFPFPPHPRVARSSITTNHADR